MTPALGRALGAPMASRFLGPSVHSNSGVAYKPVSFVSVGDGSTNNSHFLSALNMTEYASVLGLKCPLIVCVTNNKLCISLKDESEWLAKHLNRYIRNELIGFFHCENGTDMFDVWKTMNDGYQFALKKQRPVIFLVDGIVRQFGHAATDRQLAYLSTAEIESMQDSSVIFNLFLQTCDKNEGIMDASQFLENLIKISHLTRFAFDSVASVEPKWTDSAADRSALIARNSPSVNTGDVSRLTVESFLGYDKTDEILQSEKKEKFVRLCDMDELSTIKRGRKNVMRKLMNGIIEEVMVKYPECVYIGEDVRHGGYYLVTDGLTDISTNGVRSRIYDFPPDESSLIGCGLGFAQSGLLPIVEIPYAKYLDCGFDMFNECGILHWLSNHTPSDCDSHSESESRKKKGAPMMIRLQGFGNGMFGGNFHTHNVIHLMPGLDTVCFSNGSDYVKGWRYAMDQIRRNGRFVMSVDCTKLLNVRSSEMMQQMPMFDRGEFLTFDDVIVYSNTTNNDSGANFTKTIVSDTLRDLETSGNPTNTDETYSVDFSFDSGSVILITYGLGVEICKEVMSELNNEKDGSPKVHIIDTPYLSNVPRMLEEILLKNRNAKLRVIFADICKPNGAPLNNFATALHNRGLLDGHEWRTVNAQPTYNLLGRECTFLNKTDIFDCLREIM